MMERDSLIFAIIGVLGVLVIVNLLVTFNLTSGGIASVTGSAVEEKTEVTVDENALLVEELKKENSELKSENEALEEKVKELEAKLSEIEEEEEISKEVCPLTCAEDEICAPINKADGSVKWQCIDDPEDVLGA